MDEEKTEVAGIAFRLLAPGDEGRGERANLFVYEVEVAESHQRRGIASTLFARLVELARERGIRAGFVLTEPDNDPANALYRSAGGASSTVVEWDFSYAAD